MSHPMASQARDIPRDTPRMGRICWSGAHSPVVTGVVRWFNSPLPTQLVPIFEDPGSAFFRLSRGRHGDARNWPAIDAWADAPAREIITASAVEPGRR